MAFIYDDGNPADAAAEFQHFGELFRFLFDVMVNRIRVRRPGAVGMLSSMLSVDRDFCHFCLLRNMSSQTVYHFMESEV